MEHGNKKYNFEVLQKDGDILVVKPANIYSLKTSMRKFFGKGLNDRFDFDPLPDGQILIKRTS